MTTMIAQLAKSYDIPIEEFILTKKTLSVSGAWRGESGAVEEDGVLKLTKEEIKDIREKAKLKKEDLDNWKSDRKAKMFVQKLERILLHSEDGTLETRTMKGKIHVEDGKIIYVGQKTVYYFGDLVDGKVPEGVDIRKDRFGAKIAKLKERTNTGGKYLNLTLKQWRECTKHVFAATTLRVKRKTTTQTTNTVKKFVDNMESIIPVAMNL